MSRRRPPTEPPPLAQPMPSELVAHGLSRIAGEEGLTLEAHGQCMEPIIRDGEAVTLSRARWPLPGDIVAVLDDLGRIRVHRLLGYRPAWRGRPALDLVTRADNQRWVDPPASMRRLIGRVTSIEGRPTAQVRFRQRATAIVAFFLASASWLWRRLRSRAAGPRA